MTPTEQDKKLRWKIARQMAAHRYPWGHTTQGEKNEAAREAMESPYFENIMQLITADRKRVAIEAYNAMTKEVVNHLERIEKSEGGAMLDLAALSGVLKHDENARFARDRLVSERRACSIILSVAAELKAQQEEV